MSEKTAAEAMREAAAQLLESKGYGHWETLAALIRRLPLPDPTPDPRDEALRLVETKLGDIFSVVSYINIHGVGPQPQPTGEPQPIRVPPDEFWQLFQKIGEDANAALAAIEAIKGGV